MKHTKAIELILSFILIAVMLVGCNGGTEDDGTTTDATTTTTANTQSEQQDPPTNEITITFNGNGYTASQTGVLSANGNILTITEPGRYRLSGTLDNAQLRVAVEKNEIVELVFAGINITNQSSAPLYIESADKVFIELASGTENFLTDAKTYLFPEGGDKPNACLYSSEDLTFSGTGALTVKANYNNGIGSKNDLKIEDGNITVEAAKNALKGNQSVKIKGGTVTLKGMDGIKSDEVVEGEGIVEITGGVVSIVASDDGIQAYNGITIANGANVTVDAADQDLNCDNAANISVASDALTSK